MLLELSTDQRALRDTSRELLKARSPMGRVRELADDPIGFDRELWKESAQLGWSALLVPEKYGGGSASGVGLVDLAIIAEELGRALHPSPFQPTNIVAGAVAEFGSPEQRARFLPGIAAGDLIASWALFEPKGEWSARSIAMAASPAGSGFVLNGSKTCVQDAASANFLVVAALTPTGLSQFLVDTDSPGIAIEPLESLDLTNRLYQVQFTDVAVRPGDVLGDLGAGERSVTRMLHLALVLQCADSNGATDVAFGTTVQYSKDRVAFGRPIGSYQALKHRMASHRMRLEGCFAIAAYAAGCVGEQRRDAAVAAHVAKAYVGKWDTLILHDCIQLHGGIAMTWEYDLHLFVRRAMSNEMLYGPPRDHCRALVELAEGSEQ
jgi:alkylation response protein AidB-like acyl-CoA dehydrogenase